MIAENLQNLYDLLAYILTTIGVLPVLEQVFGYLGLGIVPKLLIVLIESVIILGVVALVVMGLTWLERKVLGHAQARLGPMITGPHGLLQPIVDGIKLLTKEDLIPRNADKWAFTAAPFFAFVPSLLVFVPMPFGKGIIVSDLPTGILFIIAVSAISPIGVLLAGWASNNKYSLLGALRAVAQDISYEIPMVITVIGVVLITGSLSMQDIVLAQSDSILGVIPKWFIILQPLGFIIFLITAIAETGRTPFDLQESESELVAGFFTEYSGMKFSLFFLAEYAHLFAIGGIITTLYLGGWNGPTIPFLPEALTSLVWFSIKVFAIIFFAMWLRATVPRVRIDQLLELGWKILIPLSLLNVFVTGILVLWGVL